MNKQILFVILIVLVLIAVGGVVIYFSIMSDQAPTEDSVISRGGFFPFFGGQEDASKSGGEEETTDNTLGGLGEDSFGSKTLPSLRKLWSEPVAGAIFTTDEQGIVSVRFVERATGNVYETHATSTKTARLTNTTIPRIQEVLWLSPENLVLRYLRDEGDTIETFSATLVLPDPEEETATSSIEVLGELRGQFLPINILDITGTDNTLFYLLRESSGVRGVVSNTDGSGAREVFSSPIREWVSQFVDPQTVALTTKASGGVLGHLFFLNTSSGALKAVLSSFSGLTTNVGEASVLYTEQETVLPLLFSYDYTQAKTVSLPISTLAEKCVWDSQSATVAFCATPKSLVSGVLPDVWYQGAVHFNDELWRVETNTLSSKLIFDPEVLAKTTFDMVDLALDQKDELLIFRNKVDNSLWLYRFEAPKENVTPF